MAFGIEDLQGLHFAKLKIDQHRRNVPSQVVWCGERTSGCHAKKENESDGEAAKRDVKRHPQP